MPTTRRIEDGMKVLMLVALLGGILAGCAGTLDQRFDATDRQIIAAATLEALEKNKTGEGKNWINPASDRRGTVIPMRTFKRSGLPCRKFQQTATLEGRTIIAYDIACRRDDGQWKSETYASLDGAISDAPSYRDQRYYDDRYYRYDRYRYPYGYPYGPHGRLWYYR